MTPNQPDKCCGSCRFWELQVDFPKHGCCRYPMPFFMPTVVDKTTGKRYTENELTDLVKTLLPEFYSHSAKYVVRATCLDYISGRWHINFYINETHNIKLLPSRFSVLDSDSIPKEQVRKMIEEILSYAADFCNHEEGCAGHCIYSNVDRIASKYLNEPLP